MIDLVVPGFQRLLLEYLVLDMNGTIAVDGLLIEGVRSRLKELGRQLQVHVLTADTFGTVRQQLEGLGCVIRVIGPDEQDEQKKQYIHQLGCDSVVAIGNGRNDALMLKDARLGIAVIQGEGAAAAAVLHADIVTHDIRDALDLLLVKKRLLATLRN